jgi:hypothetical protein
MGSRQFAVRRGGIAVAAAVVCLGVAIASCGSDGASSSSEAKIDRLRESAAAIPRGERIPELAGKSVTPMRAALTPVHWRMAKVVGPRVVEIYSGAGYCVGSEPPPRFLAVRSWRRGSNIYVAPFIAVRRASSGVCRGVGYWQYGTVHLDRSLKGVRLFDATTSPPSLRWPRPAGVNG